MDKWFKFRLQREDFVAVWHITYTPWFPGNIKPAYPGVYETQERDGPNFYNYFDGENWHWGSDTPENARTDDPMTARRQKEFVVQWRGLSINTEKLK